MCPRRTAGAVGTEWRRQQRETPSRRPSPAQATCEWPPARIGSSNSRGALPHPGRPPPGAWATLHLSFAHPTSSPLPESVKSANRVQTLSIWAPVVALSTPASPQTSNGLPVPLLPSPRARHHSRQAGQTDPGRCFGSCHAGGSLAHKKQTLKSHPTWVPLEPDPDSDLRAGHLGEHAELRREGWARRSDPAAHSMRGSPPTKRLSTRYRDRLCSRITLTLQKQQLWLPDPWRERKVSNNRPAEISARRAPRLTFTGPTKPGPCPIFLTFPQSHSLQVTRHTRAGNPTSAPAPGRDSAPL